MEPTLKKKFSLKVLRTAFELRIQEGNSFSQILSAAKEIPPDATLTKICQDGIFVELTFTEEKSDQ